MLYIGPYYLKIRLFNLKDIQNIETKEKVLSIFDM